MPKVYNKRYNDAPADAVYVGRPTIWGNPFCLGKDGDREEVIEKYEHWLMAKPWLVERARKELRGKDLVCWCAPQKCHADVLIRVANQK